MISVSNEYKEIMNRPVRNRAFISVGIGIINQNAQASGKASGNFAYWSYGNIFDANAKRIEYATLEEDFMRANGSQLFLPENDELMQLRQNGVVTEDIMGQVRIGFPQVYSLKGLTIEFGSVFPCGFDIITSEKTFSFENKSQKFMTDVVIGDTDYIVIKPTEMVRGNQRLRINSILMGIGLQYGNQQTQSFSAKEYVSSISEDLSSESMSFSFYDEEDYFNVDDNNSFIYFMETMQKISVSFGLEKDSGEVEWHQISTQYLKDWKSQKGIVTLNATDRLSTMNEEYTLANRIYTRTAYKEAKSIFADAGLEPDEYYIDDYLEDVNLVNPMPNGSRKECLQMLANACRCIIKSDENGVIKIIPNFALVLDPEDFSVSTNGHTEWSKPENLFIGTPVVYADMTSNFMRADGKMYFLPEDTNYLETSYVSENVSDIFGDFSTIPTITVTLPASYSYNGVHIVFDGNPPRILKIITYKNGKSNEVVTFKNLSKKSFLFHEFKTFDQMVFQFTNAYPNNRVLVNSISFGDFTDYTLEKKNMLENPIGYKEKRTKSIKVKRYTYTTDEQGEPKEVEDNVFTEYTVGDVGEVRTVQNPLINTVEHAELIAEWIGNYYSNNVSYDVDYRGEPRLNAADIIHMESDKKNNLQVEVVSSEIKFNGAFSGSLELRRASKSMGG